MMGRQKAPEKLFFQFRLEDHVTADQHLRQLDAVLNYDQTRTVLAGHYSPIGRPSIDPELMLRMLLVGYAFGIRSERQLCREVDLNLAYRWFCRLGLDGAVPDAFADCGEDRVALIKRRVDPIDPRLGFIVHHLSFLSVISAA